MSSSRVNTVIANYRLTDFLGAGGMGEVYRGVHVQTGQVVAIKVFSPEIEARELARFYHEARVHSTLQHPNIVRFIELVTIDGRPCLVMEYVEGESLADQITRAGRLAPDVALRSVRDIARALAYVHAAGFVHRDIKPANVRVARDGSVKLLDFGIAKSDSVEGLTKTGNVIGTPRYLSPEQLFGEPVGPASDIWALGVLLYELVTGVAPFDGDTTARLYARIDAATYTPPSHVIPSDQDGDTRGLMRSVDAIVKSCLTRDPKRRMPSATQLADRADAALQPQGDGVKAWAHAQGARVKGWAQPKRERVNAPDETPSSAFAVPATSVLAFLERSWWWLAGAAVVVAIIVVWVNSSGASGPHGEATVFHIEVVPGRAEVFVNGVDQGTTPLEYAGYVGENIQVDLKQDGFEPLHVPITVSVNGTTTLTMVSRRLP